MKDRKSGKERKHGQSGDVCGEGRKEEVSCVCLCACVRMRVCARLVDGVGYAIRH